VDFSCESTENMGKTAQSYSTKANGWLLKLPEEERKFFKVEDKKVVCKVSKNYKIVPFESGQ